ncbi:ATP/GTP-binding site motif A (P-loop):ABC transporter:AAA ATPase:TOBE domain [Stappia aggregata IAM 12614]|uniref:ATP/GTP-binding site motif A (P-loop):ABC transporter:AAA ATPase:TOBE domain n=1 Tax=Roseibium aggregatum (strain ATCC 25650 / DSM 13394 / JCM 20685 / NBRC 16684 / NCIMB 2208 / IAM 12614 / B1) TaxID=384765 RepID=A0NXG9_ROSAI|nr:molybdenum ABC transporter ATP-binding protein [Roseibium aggregatum]EAV42496.1 ATP/GTP-binding site motif A (P-loop):ABC transporter:AAA ATPase:TOBE domain [Stappia aggregata IAM 12614] [Roseibium aggregatum IAM 12614]
MLDVDIKGRVGQLDLEARFASGGGVTSLFGQSGAGKTTLTNMIAGLIKPISGHIAVNGTTLFDAQKGINLSVQARRIGHVFQDARLFPHLSVASNLTYARWAGRRPGTRDMAEVVDLLGLGNLLERKPGTLSGGEKQRVAIGRALLSDPRLLIMDEPLANLDQARRNDILPYLDRLCVEAGIPILYVSHSIEEVARLSNTLVILSDGRTPAFGPVADMLARTDLGRATGRHEASALLEGTVTRCDPDWGLTDVDIGGAILQIPDMAAEPGDAVRLRIRARDVALAVVPPEGLSIRNAFGATIRSISSENGPYAEILCSVRGQVLRARITRASVADLDLHTGKDVTVLIKSVAIDRRQRAPALADADTGGNSAG